MNNLILLSLALAPVVAFATYIFYKDKWEKEPLKLLIWCFLGGMVSCIPIIIFEVSTDLLFKPNHDNIFDAFISAFFFVGFTEEFWKWIAVLLLAYRNKNFNEPYDGITYAVMVSLGFAAIENILYVFQGGILVGFLRAFTAVPAHTIMGILMGYFLGMAKCNPKAKATNLILSIVTPVLMHGFYDLSIFAYGGAYAWIGAIISLLIGAYLSKKAIQIHAQNSPFKF
ncbi:MAG TPA: PrsW family glutamic-type intramembrane protease [Bacteroidia bacterium]